MPILKPSIHIICCFISAVSEGLVAIPGAFGQEVGGTFTLHIVRRYDLSKPYNNNTFLFLPAANERCCCCDINSKGSIDMKFSLKPCLKSSLYSSNQCCEIWKHVKLKTEQNYKVVKYDFLAAGQDFSKPKRKKLFFKNRKKIKWSEIEK